MTRRIEPDPGQESVWDYPRPPRVETVPQRVRVIFCGETIAETNRALRVLETSHPPAYYLPRAHLRMELLKLTSRRSFCEYKGVASYWSLTLGEQSSPYCAWSYETPSPGYEAIAGYLSFYASMVDACYVGEEKVRPQEGDYYGGWITSWIVGPFKGGSGTSGW